jgi:Mn2+/Fe2+ NRAMP family transporter
MLIAGNIMVLKHKRWNKDNVKQLLWVIIGIWICLPLALFLFFRRDDINPLLISYMVILTFLIVIQHFITFKTFKVKNHRI